MNSHFLQKAVSFVTNEDGPTAVEYAVMLALIIAICMATAGTLGSKTSATFNSVSNALSVSSS